MNLTYLQKHPRIQYLIKIKNFSFSYSFRVCTYIELCTVYESSSFWLTLEMVILANT